jgi:hypothetical protein
VLVAFLKVSLDVTEAVNGDDLFVIDLDESIDLGVGGFTVVRAWSLSLSFPPLVSLSSQSPKPVSIPFNPRRFTLSSFGSSSTSATRLSPVAKSVIFGVGRSSGRVTTRTGDTGNGGVNDTEDGAETEADIVCNIADDVAVNPAGTHVEFRYSTLTFADAKVDFAEGTVLFDGGIIDTSGAETKDVS